MASILRHNDIRSLVRLAFCDGCALTLAFTVALVLPARDQQKGMPALTGKIKAMATSRQADTGNLFAVIDGHGPYQLQAGAGRNQGV
jgi:hypothetical protein